jgi:hypothetical protein
LWRAYIIDYMAQGPMLIFDKSFLESLNPDEAMWLDNFFLTSITPLFFVETLADLEKKVRQGRTPEEVVGSLAYKTPDLQSHVNPHHASVLADELSGYPVAMDGRIMKAGGTVMQLDGQQGIIYKMSPEEEAFQRWQRGEFLDLERQIAKAWRRGVSGLDYSQSYSLFKGLYGAIRKPKDLKDAKYVADTLIDLIDEEKSFLFGLSLLGVQAAGAQDVIKRWKAAGAPPIGKFCPYFRYMFSVELFYYLAIGADLISRVRPAGKAGNKVDMAYLYYLPFCLVFVSNDKLHERVVPLFLRDDQTFVRGQELKTDLANIDRHFDAFPEDVKAKGIFSFASDPPSDTSFVITRLWDKHLPNWRKQRQEHKELSPEAQKTLMDLVKRLSKEGKPVSSNAPADIQDMSYVNIERQILRKKGKWMRVPPEA